MTKPNKLYPGVAIARNGRYLAKVSRGKTIHLGTYDTPEEAYEVYKQFIEANPPAKPGVPKGINSKTLKPPTRKLLNDFRGTWLYGL